MAVTLYRIAKETSQYPAADMTGNGAKATGGRWNSKGQPVIYVSSSIALATLETLAHLGDNIAVRNRFLIQVTVPPAVWGRRQTLLPTALLPTWSAEPPGMTSINIGDAWLSGGESALLEVPSVIVPEEYNILINPAHLDTNKLKAIVIRRYDYDPRL